MTDYRTNREKFELLQKILDNISYRLQFINGMPRDLQSINKDLQDLVTFIQDQIEIDWT